MAHVVALVAVALLTLAGVRSAVMQAAELRAPSMPMCGMAMEGAGTERHAPGKAHARCEFCAAAAHAPIGGAAATAPVSVAVAWIVWRPLAARGARGPPAFTARARGPPAAPLTA